LYWVPRTPASRALKSLLDAGGFVYEAVAVTSFEEIDSPEIRSLNPEGMMPFVVWDEKVYTDVADAMKKLCQGLPFLTQYYPSDVMEQ